MHTVTKSNKRLALLFAIITLPGITNNASASTLDSVSHIHHVKVVENKVLVLTHEGLFELVGKVDFHFLEGAGSDLYGADSQSGNLIYSADSGKTWSTLGANTFTDIAVSPDMPAMAVAINNSELLLTENAFKSTTKIKNALKFTQIEWRNSGLYALSGSSLYKSTNSGKIWTKLSTFKGVPGILSASDQLMLVTVGSDIYTSSNAGKKFKIFS